MVCLCRMGVRLILPRACFSDGVTVPVGLGKWRFGYVLDPWSGVRGLYTTAQYDTNQSSFRGISLSLLHDISWIRLLYPTRLGFLISLSCLCLVHSVVFSPAQSGTVVVLVGQGRPPFMAVTSSAYGCRSVWVQSQDEHRLPTFVSGSCYSVLFGSITDFWIRRWMGLNRVKAE